MYYLVIHIILKRWCYAAVMNNSLKNDVFKAQRMYYLSNKLDERVLPSLKRFSMEVLNRYTKMAKSYNMELTNEEMINRVIF